jgi:DNA-binding NtrC family response regulator
VIDHGSTNGTFAGSVRIERAVIAPGTTLTLGATALRVGDAPLAEVEVHGEDMLGGVVGGSALMRRLMAQVHKAAASEVSVLVNGESGTGKELIARALHDLGPRSKGPFITVDCGSIAPTLIASELFGHEKGAFTGADRAHVGAFEAAHGGTIFLDEIGELQPAIQATLLGVLERRKLRRVGSRAEIEIDVRVVSATHRDLRAEVNANTFRLDLYYRLAVVTLVIPPLRERPEDIPLLVEHFLRDAGYEGAVAALISPAAMQALQRLHYAGNVRELRNLIEAAVAMNEPPDVSSSPTSPSPRAVATDLALPYKEARAQVLDAFEAQYLDALMERAGGNVSQAARIAKMTRSHLSELLAKRK